MFVNGEMSVELGRVHQQLGAQFTKVNNVPVINDYGDPAAEYHHLRHSAALLDLSCRGRLCVAGADRLRFLHGQVTNDLAGLPAGQGCYTAITNAKGKVVADANVYLLENEILLDFEPGLTPTLFARLEKYIVADDVELISVNDSYKMLAVAGPRAGEALAGVQWGFGLPAGELQWTCTRERAGGEIYCARHARGTAAGFDLFLPADDTSWLYDELLAQVRAHGGGPAGWQALETVRIEAGIPRFGQDMDESNLAPETGIESRAISYSKGCYIGQEIIARIRTYGQVAKSLRRLVLEAGPLAKARDILLRDDREVGYLTSVVHSPVRGKVIALGYVRREHHQLGTALTVRTQGGPVGAQVIE